MQILIVEDDIHVRTLLREMMEPICGHVLEGMNGLEAVALYDQYEPDIVLMDVRMPGLDGIDATRRIVARHRDATVLIVTEYNKASYRTSAGEAGAAGFFLKDNLLELRRHIAMLCEKSLPH